MIKKENPYKIKVPVYSSELIEKNNGLFEVLSYVNMVEHVDKKISDYILHKPPVKRKKRSKVKEIEIQNVESFEYFVETIPCRLLKITAFNTNLIDGFLETDTKINLSKSDKLGSETNYMLLYPRILGLSHNSCNFQWRILVYEDPTKENFEIVSICKLVLNKILNIKIKNIKLDKLLKELKENAILERLEIQFNSQSDDINEVDTYLRQYLIESKIKKVRTEKFSNVPISNFQKLINDTNYTGDFSKRIIKFFLKKKEIKITDEYLDAKEKIDQTVEEIFNSSIVLEENEIDLIFNNDFIFEKLVGVLNEYLEDNT